MAAKTKPARMRNMAVPHRLLRAHWPRGDRRFRSRRGGRSFPGYFVDEMASARPLRQDRSETGKQRFERRRELPWRVADDEARAVEGAASIALADRKLGPQNPADAAFRQTQPQ